MGNDEWSGAVDIALDVFAVCIILAFVIVLAKIGTSVNATIAIENAAVEQVQEYREYNGYDNKEIYGADVVSCILTMRGKVPVTVEGVVYGVESSYTVEEINSLYPAENKYKSTLIRDEVDSACILGINIERVV